MRKYFFTAAAAASLLTIASCEKEIMVKTPPYEPTLVVNGTVNVSESPMVYVSKSVGLADYNHNKKLWVDNAKVLLYKEGSIVDSLVFQAVSGAYMGHTTIEPGSSYKVSVTAPGFTDLSATGRAPSLVQLKSVSHIKGARLSADGQLQDEIRISFDDPSSPGDYYILGMDIYDPASDTAVPLGCVNTTDASVESIYDEQIDNTTCLNGGEIFFRDELFNGSTRQMRFFVNSSYLQRLGGGAVFTVSLRHVSEAYFRYRKSFLYAAENAGNPFSEPTRVYTNVNGGYGIFGIINEDVKNIN